MLFTILLAAPVFADRSTEDLQSKVIERFDAPSAGADANSKYEYPQNHKWIVRGSKFFAGGPDKVKFDWIKTHPDALYPKGVPDGQVANSLGIQGAFDRKGYNYIELIPVEDQNDKDGKPVETGIPIPGRAKFLDMWVWGSNYNYYVEIHLRDYRGLTHVLKMGDLNYRGWKNLKIDIPGYIPQDVSYVPSRKGLELVKIVMWTRPEEAVNSFYVYFDQIKVLTDMFEQPFDGSGLSEQDTIDKLWAGSGQKN
jgi:hypothetical protein